MAGLIGKRLLCGIFHIWLNKLFLFSMNRQPNSWMGYNVKNNFELTWQEESPSFEPPEWVDDERWDKKHLHIIVKIPSLTNTLKKQAKLLSNYQLTVIKHFLLWWQLLQKYKAYSYCDVSFLLVGKPNVCDVKNVLPPTVLTHLDHLRDEPAHQGSILQSSEQGHVEQYDICVHTSQPCQINVLVISELFKRTGTRSISYLTFTTE